MRRRPYRCLDCGRRGWARQESPVDMHAWRNNGSERTPAAPSDRSSPRAAVPEAQALDEAFGYEGPMRTGEPDVGAIDRLWEAPCVVSDAPGRRVCRT